MTELAVKDGPLNRIWHNFCQFISVSAVAILYRMRVFDRENVPKNGPVLILCNHQSFLDPMFSHSWVWRPFFFLARETLFRGLFGVLIRSVYAVPIHQGKADLAAVKTIINLLKQGKPVCIYPEGSRTFDGRIADLRPGFCLIVRRTGAPIVPVVIDGAFECWPRTRKYPRLTGRVAVVYGKPIMADHVKQMGDEEFAREFTQLLRDMQGNLRQKIGKEPMDYSTPVPTDY